MKNRLLKATMALGLLLVGLGVSVATAAKQQSPIPVPTAGTTMKIGDIARLINRSPETTGTLPAQPIMLAPKATGGGKVPMGVSAYQAARKNSFIIGRTSKMNSVSPVHAQPSPAVDLRCQPDNQTLVTLRSATTDHIEALLAYNNATAHREKLRKCLLWFEYKGYALFPFVDPWVSNLATALNKFSTSN